MPSSFLLPCLLAFPVLAHSPCLSYRYHVSPCRHVFDSCNYSRSGCGALPTSEHGLRQAKVLEPLRCHHMVHMGVKPLREQCWRETEASQEVK